MKFFRRICSIMIRPRTTMRAILDAPAGREVVPLVLLATLSAFAGNANENVRGSLKHAPMPWLIVACALIVTALVMLLLFYGFAWLAYAAGRFLEGEGSPVAVRSALAWGMAPIIWALLYRVPAALFGPAQGLAQVRVGDDRLRIDPGQFTSGCFIALVFALLELGVLVWYLVVASRTLGEAHRFSAWRGLGTLLIVGITPLIVIIAAVLAIS
jgi:hypothetical protein